MLTIFQNTENHIYNIICEKQRFSSCNLAGVVALLDSAQYLNLRSSNPQSMKQDRKPGRPRQWVLNEEIIEIHKLTAKLKMQNPNAHWSAIRDLLKTQLEQERKQDLLSKLDKLWGLIKQVIPVPPKCICGHRTNTYTYNKVENESEHYWEIFARCTNCRYLRRYLPSASYSWSRPKSIIRELEKTPTFYELDGQKVEGEER